MIEDSKSWREADKDIAFQHLIPWAFETGIAAMPQDRERTATLFGDYVYQNCRDGHPQLSYLGID